jgi:hypothetical protein
MFLKGNRVIKTVERGRKGMNNYPLIGVSICAVVLLILGSLSNVVGYQTIQSSGVNDSPLFSARTQRATNQQQNSITSQYLGKGQYTIPFPLRDNRTELIQKIIDRISTMDDETFNRFVDSFMRYIHQNNALNSVNAMEIIQELHQIRETPKDIIIEKDSDSSNNTYPSNFIRIIIILAALYIMSIILFFTIIIMGVLLTIIPIFPHKTSGCNF